MGRIVVVGSLNQDQRIRVRTIPRPGETILADDVQRSAGGKGANQAVAVARFDGDCLLIGAVGADEEGARLLKTLGAAGVDTARVRILPGRTTGQATVLVDDDGQNCIVVASGANLGLDDATVRAELDRAGAVATVLTQGEISTECIAACAEYCRSHDVRLVVNLAPYRDISPGVVELCDPLIVNEFEGEALGDELGIAAAAPSELARALVEHCRSVMITLGGDGAVYADRSGDGQVPAPRVEVVDTTGAGDAFVGAAAAALSRGDGLAAACRAGVEAGSRAVQHHGAQL